MCPNYRRNCRFSRWASLGLLLPKNGGFSADALLMDRHRAPAMSLDTVCFGVYVDGVCAVGCNRQKVLAAVDAVKGVPGRCGPAVP